jgi:hypothetical protein
MSNMTCAKVERVSRRAFLKTMARAAAAACVSGAGIFLFAKKRIAYRDEHACDARVLCGGCSRLEGCVLPQALFSRLAPERFSFARPSGDDSKRGEVPRAPAYPVQNGTRYE